MFYRKLHVLQDAAGVKRFGLHGIRRTACTALAKHNLTAAQLALGHRHVSMTIDRYTAPTEIVRDALKTLPQPFSETALEVKPV